jgi:4-hydroxyacetophenone monooxygenase
MYGPGTNAVNGVSIIYMSECQMHYIMGCLDLLIAENLSSLEPRTQVHADYRRRSQEAASEMVYTHPSVSSYYKNSAGSTPTLFPFRIIDYWRWTRRPNPDDLELHGRRHP